MPSPILALRTNRRLPITSVRSWVATLRPTSATTGVPDGRVRCGPRADWAGVDRYLLAPVVLPSMGVAPAPVKAIYGATQGTPALGALLVGEASVAGPTANL